MSKENNPDLTVGERGFMAGLAHGNASHIKHRDHLVNGDDIYQFQKGIILGVLAFVGEELGMESASLMADDVASGMFETAVKRGARDRPVPEALKG